MTGASSRSAGPKGKITAEVECGKRVRHAVSRIQHQFSGNDPSMPIVPNNRCGNLVNRLSRRHVSGASGTADE
jgi:hypothetical protein